MTYGVMVLSLFAQLTYVNLQHWIVGLYYYGFLVNEDIGLILVIQLLLVYYIIRMASKPLLLYDPLLFTLLYLNHIRLYKTLNAVFTLLMLWFIYVYAHFYMFIYYYYYHALGVLK